jgi:hypothetical protein
VVSDSRFGSVFASLSEIGSLACDFSRSGGGRDARIGDDTSWTERALCRSLRKADVAVVGEQAAEKALGDEDAIEDMEKRCELSRFFSFLLTSLLQMSRCSNRRRALPSPRVEDFL